MNLEDYEKISIKEINKMKTQMGLVVEQEEELTPEDLTGLRVMVYYNLHKHTFSVTYGGKVILYTPIMLN